MNLILVTSQSLLVISMVLSQDDSFDEFEMYAERWDKEEQTEKPKNLYPTRPRAACGLLNHQARLCTCVIISPVCALTAARCLHDNDGKVYPPANITLFSDQTSITIDKSYVAQQPGDRISFHPDYLPYDPLGSKYKIGMICSKKQFLPSDTTVEVAYTHYKKGSMHFKKCYAYFWLQDNLDHKRYRLAKREARRNPMKECANAYHQMYPGKLTETFDGHLMCAGWGSELHCSIDTYGAPYLCDFDMFECVRGIWIGNIEIPGYEINCGGHGTDPELPEVFASISSALFADYQDIQPDKNQPRNRQKREVDDENLWRLNEGKRSRFGAGIRGHRRPPAGSNHKMKFRGSGQKRKVPGAKLKFGTKNRSRKRLFRGEGQVRTRWRPRRNWRRRYRWK